MVNEFEIGRKVNCHMRVVDFSASLGCRRRRDGRRLPRPPRSLLEHLFGPERGLGALRLTREIGYGILWGVIRAFASPLAGASCEVQALAPTLCR